MSRAPDHTRDSARAQYVYVSLRGGRNGLRTSIAVHSLYTTSVGNLYRLFPEFAGAPCQVDEVAGTWQWRHPQEGVHDFLRIERHKVL